MGDTMNLKNKKTLLLQLLFMTVGCVLYGAGISLFLNPNDLAPGGLSGISVMLSRFVPLDVGMLIIIMNVPLFIVAFVKFGREFTVMTLFGTVLLSVFTDLFTNLVTVTVTDDRLLAGVFGGGLMSLGLGLVFRSGGTTGGSDIIVRLLRRKYRHIKTGKVFLITDIVIVAASAIVFGNIETALYAAIALAVQSVVLDLVLYGGLGARLIFIVTTSPDQINLQLIDRLGISTTLIKGQGGFSGSEKTVLMVVAKKHLFPKIRDTVGEIDPQSFLIASSASEIFGEGYMSIFANEL
ncbi:MAG: YitT family protein [Clostridia bacterium]|nr:YitT family protein [Clostridia bacterium]